MMGLMGRYVYKYPRPAVAADVAAMRLENQSLKVLLIRRGFEPFKDKWALPGGFMNIDESPQQAAIRELAEETALSIKPILMEQIGAFGHPHRDPRTRVVGIAYLALYKTRPRGLAASDDAAALDWFNVRRLPDLAFDHGQILRAAVALLQWKVRSTTTAFRLAGRQFTVAQLRAVLQVILNKELDKRRFTQKIIIAGVVQPVGYNQGGERTYRLAPGAGRSKFVLEI